MTSRFALGVAVAVALGCGGAVTKTDAPAAKDPAAGTATPASSSGSSLTLGPVPGKAAWPTASEQVLKDIVSGCIADVYGSRGWTGSLEVTNSYWVSARGDRKLEDCTTLRLRDRGIGTDDFAAVVRAEPDPAVLKAITVTGEAPPAAQVAIARRAAWCAAPYRDRVVDFKVLSRAHVDPGEEFAAVDFHDMAQVPDSPTAGEVRSCLYDSSSSLIDGAAAEGDYNVAIEVKFGNPPAAPALKVTPQGTTPAAIVTAVEPMIRACAAYKVSQSPDWKPYHLVLRVAKNADYGSISIGEGSGTSAVFESCLTSGDTSGIAIGEYDIAVDPG